MRRGVILTSAAGGARATRLTGGATAMLAGTAAPAGGSSATKSEVARSGGNVSANLLPAQGRRVWAGGLTLIAALALEAPRVSAASGGLDPSFGQGGMVATFMSDQGSDRAHAIAADAGTSRVVVAGSATVDGWPWVAIARYNADGTLDTTFGTGGRVLDRGPACLASEAYAVAVHPAHALYGLAIDGARNVWFSQSSGSADDAADSASVGYLKGGDWVACASHDAGRCSFLSLRRRRSSARQASRWPARHPQPVRGWSATGPGAARDVPSVVTGCSERRHAAFSMRLSSSGQARVLPDAP